MSHDEERRLRQIERELEREDPPFAEHIRVANCASAVTTARCATFVAISGAALALLGLLAGSVAFGVLGFVLAMVGQAVRLAVASTGHRS